jgi:Glycosidases
MPWDAAAANYGFSSGTPWLPVGPAHKALAVSEQEKDPDSTLAYARKFLAARKAEPALVTGEMKFIPAPLPVLAFARTLGKERLVGIFNLSRQPVAFDLGPLGAMKPLDLGCGETTVRGNTLDLGPLACWFGRG